MCAYQNLTEMVQNWTEQLWRSVLVRAAKDLFTVCWLWLLQRLFDDVPEVGELIYKYIVRQHGSAGHGLNAADFAAGVRDIIDLGGESYQMDFYFNVFSGGHSLKQNGRSLFSSTDACDMW